MRNLTRAKASSFAVLPGSRRRKRRFNALTRRTSSPALYDAFRRCVLRLAAERKIVLSAKLRKELDRVTTTKPIHLKLRGCGLDVEGVAVLFEALQSYPCVDKLDLRGHSKAVAAKASELALKLISRQVAATLAPLTTEKLQTNDFARRFHGVLAPGVVEQTCVLRRVKLDKTSKLNHLQALAVRVNERLAVRHCFLAKTKETFSLSQILALEAAVDAVHCAARDPNKVQLSETTKKNKGFFFRGSSKQPSKQQEDTRTIGNDVPTFETFVYTKLERQSILGAPSPEDLALLAPIIDAFASVQAPVADTDLTDTVLFQRFCTDDCSHHHGSSSSSSAADDDDDDDEFPEAAEEDVENVQEGGAVETDFEEIDGDDSLDDDTDDDDFDDDDDDIREVKSHSRRSTLETVPEEDEEDDDDDDDETAEAAEEDALALPEKESEKAEEEEEEEEELLTTGKPELPLSKRLEELNRTLDAVYTHAPLDDDDDDEEEEEEEDEEVRERSPSEEHPMARPPFNLSVEALRQEDQDTGKQRELFEESVDVMASEVLDAKQPDEEEDELTTKPGTLVQETKVDLSGRAVTFATALAELDAAVFLGSGSFGRVTVLNLSRNRLRWLPAEVTSRLDCLQVLDVSWNDLTTLRPVVDDDSSDDKENYLIPEVKDDVVLRSALPESLVQVEASYNRLADLGGLEACGVLRVLRVRRNKVRHLGGLEHLTLLEELDIAENSVAKVSSLRPLSCNTELRSLDLSGCPIDADPARPARPKVICVLPHLRELNGEPMPRSSLGTLERQRFREASEDLQASVALFPGGGSITDLRRTSGDVQSQRESDAKRADGGKALYRSRRAPERNLQGEPPISDEAVHRKPMASKQTSGLLVRSAKTFKKKKKIIRRTPEEQRETMAALTKDGARAPRAKVEPNDVPRVFGQPWQEEEPVKKKIPSTVTGAAAPPGKRRQSRASSVMGSTMASRSKSRTLSSQRSFASVMTRKSSFKDDASWIGRVPPSSVVDAPPPPEEDDIVEEEDLPPIPVIVAKPPPTNFTPWLDGLLTQLGHAKRAIALLERLKDHGKPARRHDDGGKSTVVGDDLVIPFRQTLADLHAFATTPPPESALEACVSAPSQLKLAATAWNECRLLVTKLKDLIFFIFPDHVTQSDGIVVKSPHGGLTLGDGNGFAKDTATIVSFGGDAMAAAVRAAKKERENMDDNRRPRPRGVSYTSSSRLADVLDEDLAEDDEDDQDKHPLANFAERLETELGRLEPVDDVSTLPDDHNVYQTRSSASNVSLSERFARLRSSSFDIFETTPRSHTHTGVRSRSSSTLDTRSIRKVEFRMSEPPRDPPPRIVDAVHDHVPYNYDDEMAKKQQSPRAYMMSLPPATTFDDVDPQEQPGPPVTSSTPKDDVVPVEPVDEDDMTLTSAAPREELLLLREEDDDDDDDSEQSMKNDDDDDVRTTTRPGLSLRERLAAVVNKEKADTESSPSSETAATPRTFSEAESIEKNEHHPPRRHEPQRSSPPRSATGTRTPQTSLSSAASEEQDVPVWREGYDPRWNRFFYFNDDTGESRWVKPDEPVVPYAPSAEPSEDASEE